MIQVGRLKPILKNVISRELQISLLKTAKFNASEKKLVPTLLKILEDGKEIDAVEVFEASRNKKILHLYMTFIQELDFQEIEKKYRESIK